MCHKCDYKTAHYGGLKLHVNNSHYNIKHLTCKLCSYRTAYTGNLQKHVKIHHKKEMDSLSYRRNKTTNVRPLTPLLDKTHYTDNVVDMDSNRGNEPPVISPLRNVKEENEVESDQVRDSDSSEESFIISDDEEVPEDTFRNKSEEEPLVKNPYFLDNSQNSTPMEQKYQINLPPSFKAFISNKGKRAPCDLCSFVGSNQNMLTSHILERHVSPD